ncbi:hypothetical protein JZ751_016011 [Albula glossodonta]|uniref:Uncharacterized protein n=1 Tax=Albula glossodonta TaxID=121402 RepID=A0A8T2NQD4_9TELE|nr:hypothetical protein JZ751_016011 [Albula glossodonta]
MSAASGTGVYRSNGRERERVLTCSGGQCSTGQEWTLFERLFEREGHHSMETEEDFHACERKELIQNQSNLSCGRCFTDCRQTQKVTRELLSQPRPEGMTEIICPKNGSERVNVALPLPKMNPHPQPDTTPPPLALPTNSPFLPMPAPPHCRLCPPLPRPLICTLCLLSSLPRGSGFGQLKRTGCLAQLVFGCLPAMKGCFRSSCRISVLSITSPAPPGAGEEVEEEGQN